MRNKERLQWPGNSRLCGKIDTESESDLRNERSIKRFVGVLSYFNEKGLITEEQYKSEIEEFLQQNYGIEENESNKNHFMKPAQFFGFIYERPDGLMGLSPLGEQALDILTGDPKVKVNKFNKLLIGQASRTQYPNPATPRVSSNVRVLPFRLLFYLFLKYKYLTREELTYKFPYIINSSFLNEDDDIDLKALHYLGEEYNKFLTWGISTFKNLGIIDEDKDKGFSVAPAYLSVVEYYFAGYKAIDLFHSEEIELHTLRKHGIQSEYVRNSAIISEAKIRDDYTDRLTGKKYAWTNAQGDPYCVVHHIVLMSNKDYYLKNYGVDIDRLDNVIVVIDETHSIMHHGCDEDREKLLILAFKCLSEKFKDSIKLTIEDYFEMYGFKKDSLSMKKYLTN